MRGGLYSDKKFHTPVNDIPPTGFQDLGEGPAIGNQTHLTLIYESKEELFASALPFLQAGLENGEYCIYINSETPQALLLDAMDTADFNFKAARDAGDLSVLTEDEAFLQNGEFDPERMIESLKKLTVKMDKEGYKGLRIAGETTWALEDNQRIDHLVEFEESINNFFQDHDCNFLCIYNRDQFPAEVLEKVIRTHPQLVFDGTVIHNFYYVPPDKYSGSENLLQTVEDQIKSLTEYTHELRKSEQYYRALATASSDVIYRMNANWNEMCELRGRGFLVDTGKWDSDWLDKFIHPDDQLWVKESIDQAIRDKSTFELEHRVLREDGTVGWTFSRVIPFIDAEGEIIEWFGTASDITERKRREEALHESKERLRLALDVEEMGLWEFDFRDHSIKMSDICKKNLGLAPDIDLSFMQFQKMMHPEDRERWSEKLRNTLQNGETLSAEFRFSSPDGRINWIYAKGRVLNSNDGSQGKVIGITQNITHRKNQEKLEHEQSRLLKYIANDRSLHETLTALCETTPQLSQGVRASVVLLNEEGTAMQASIAPDLLPSWSKKPDGGPVDDLLLGTCGKAVSTGEAVGCKNVKEDERWSDKWRKLCMANGIMAAYSEPIFDTGGNTRGSFMLCFSNPREPDSWELQLVEFGAQICSIALNHDRTKKMIREYNKRLEEQIEKRTKKLVSNQNKLRELVNRLNRTEEQERHWLARELHDNLGQLLAVCKMKLDFSFLENADPNISEASKLLDEAIVYTRELMSSLKPPDSLGDQNIRSAVKWVIKKMEEFDLMTLFEDDEQPKPLSKEACSTVLRAIRELLFNVIKHSGEKKARIKLSRTNGEVQVVVEDHGIGFDPETTDNAGKTDKGFGLFDIRERLELLEGSLKIESEPGEGTRAIITIPIAVNKKAEHKIISGEGKQLETVFTEDTDGITVLLVDDHPITREGIAKVIEYEVDLKLAGEAKNGREAIELASEKNPDVIVMDINMPDMNGIEATKRIKAEWPDIQIIGLSFHEEGDTADEMRNAGASAFITKSNAVEQLCETIRSVNVE
jgi:PAS domain S-box-containing protein